MMIFKSWYQTIPNEIRTITLYYLLYCFLFILFHLVLVSTFSFFHFLLDHDMNTIENWLYRNRWEILSFSKISSLFISTQVTKLNRYENIRYRDIFWSFNFKPSKKIFGVIFFLLIIFYALITQFGGGLVANQFREEIFYSSFMGSLMFFLIDFFFIFTLMEILKIKKAFYNSIMYTSVFLFIISSKIALPYLNKFYIFLF